MATKTKTKRNDDYETNKSVEENVASANSNDEVENDAIAKSNDECESTYMKDTKTITVYEALNERKIIKDRISKLVNSNVDCTAVYDPKTKSIYRGAKFDKAELEKLVVSRFDKINGLFKRYKLFSELIDHSNATTPITICGVDYASKSAAMAVYSVIDKEIEVYENIKIRLVDNVRKISDHRSVYLSEDKIANYISTITMSAEVDPAVVESIRNGYIEQNTLELIDPLDISTRIDDILDALIEFKERFNTEINKSNLETYIEVPLD